MKGAALAGDDALDPFWIDEPAWLVTICPLPSDDPDDDNLVELNWIGRLFGFSHATNTRMLALVGDPETPTYEILFSFDTPEHRQEFLAYVEADDYADPDDEATFLVPTADEIREAQPIGKVFPKEQADLIACVGMITAQCLMGGVDGPSA